MALYLFLIIVADADGLSYYGEPTCAGHLHMELARLRTARRNLLDAGLIAYESPFYQVLSLDRAAPPSPPSPVSASPRPEHGGPRSFAEILAEMGGRS